MLSQVAGRRKRQNCLIFGDGKRGRDERMRSPTAARMAKEVHPLISVYNNGAITPLESTDIYAKQDKTKLLLCVPCCTSCHFGTDTMPCTML